MRRTLMTLLSVGLACVPGSALAGDPGPGHHELTGPVKLLWEARYYGSNSGTNWPHALAVSPDGSRLFVTGRSWGRTQSEDYATLAYDAGTGELLWQARYDFQRGMDGASSIAISPDGNAVFVTGSSSGDYATIAYDAWSGEQIWAGPRRCCSMGWDKAFSIAAGPGSVFVTGEMTDIGSGLDYGTFGYGTPGGDWQASYVGPMPGGTDCAFSLELDPTGEWLFVTGLSDGEGTGTDYATVARFAFTGEEIWSARYDGPTSSNDAAQDIVLSPGGSKVFVTGRSWDVDSGDDYATIAYESATGLQLWAARYDGARSDHDHAKALATSPDGSLVFVTGDSMGKSGVDFATVAYDSETGARVWSNRFDGDVLRADYAEALAVTPDESVVVVGGRSMDIETDYDFMTVGYDPLTGAQLWSARYDGARSDSDSISSIAVSPDGSKLFVTGSSGLALSSVGSSERVGYVTVAYGLVRVVPIEIDPAYPGHFSATCTPGEVVTVAVLGSAAFDASLVDTESLRFGPDGAAALHDLTDPFTRAAHLIDVNLDGFTDLVTHYSMGATGIGPGDVSATLEGRTAGGRFIEGTQAISTVDCGEIPLMF